MKFELVADYLPFGDQPKAIERLVSNLKLGIKEQTLLGATGTGKTFTIANVIKEINKPTLVLAHNKTLAGQLYAELKKFFPNKAKKMPPYDAIWFEGMATRLGMRYFAPKPQPESTEKDTKE